MKKISEILLPHQYFQLIAAACATFPMISDGMQYSWSSPIIPKLRSEESPIKITPEDETWLETIYLVAALAGLPITPLVVNSLGRQKSILLAASSSLTAWIIIGAANNKIYYYTGRCIAGVASDLIFVIVPMYIAEIADATIRGFLTGLVYVMTIIGVIIMYSVAPFVPLYVPAIIATALLLFHLITFFFMPESPYFLLTKGKLELVRKSLKKLKGVEDCDDIIKEISGNLKQKNNSCSLKDALKKKSTFRALIYVTLLNTAQHFCGFSVILMNLHTILEKAHSTYLSANTSGVVMALVQLTAVIISSFTVDKYGRKALLIFSCIFTSISLLGLGVYFHLLSSKINVESVSWLPILFVLIYGLVFNVGLGVVPKIMASELFSNEFKAIGMTYGDAMYVVDGSLSLILYNYLAHYHNMYMPFYIFGCISFAMAFLTAFVIPETKGKSLEEIQKLLET